MKPERFKRTKAMIVSSAIALVAAALAFGVSSSVLGPKSASSQHLGFELTSGTSSFTITSNIYPSPACSGLTASLYPGTTRCMVFTVQNLLDVPITVQSITTALDTTFPAPPTQCAPPTYFALPTFSGSTTVGADATVNLSGVSIELIDSDSDQTPCENYTYHFLYSGSAEYTDSTTTSLASSQSSSTSGQSVTFMATVTAHNASTDGATPTSGTVTFYSCGTGSNATTCATPTTTLGTGTVGSNGEATFPTSTLSVGTDYIEAVYGGSGTNYDFASSTSNIVTQTVTSSSISTTSVLTASPNPSTYASSVTFTDTVSASPTPPNGTTVTFYSCGSGSTTSTCAGTKATLGTGTLTSGKATYSTSSLPVGTTYVEAVYPATGNYLGSTSIVAQVVNALGTTSVLTASPNPSTYASSVTFTDTVSASPTPPNGTTVTFYSCGSGSTTSTCAGTKATLGTGTLTSGKATYSTSSLPVGTTYVEAVYPATGNYLGSTSIVAQVVNALGTTSVLTASPNPSTYASSVTFTDTVSASPTPPNGTTVTFYSCGSGSTTSTCAGTKATLGTGTLTSGKATYSTSSLPVGTTYVEAVYPATGNYLGSTSIVAQVVNALGTTSVLTASPNPSTYASSVTFTDTVSASPTPPNGTTVTFYSCGSGSTTSTCAGTKATLGTGTLTSGKATYSTSSLPVGTTYVEAVYPATGNYLGSTSIVAQVVNALGTTSVLTASPNPSTYASSVTFTDTVSASPTPPNGTTVTFYSCGSGSTTSTCAGTKATLGTGTLTSGKATYSTSSLPVGTTYVEAVYPATGNYLGSTSIVAQVVNGNTTSTALTSSPNPSTFGLPVLFTATVSSSAGTPAGTVSFYGCSVSGCTPNALLGTGTLSSGKATFSSSILPVGTAYVDAVYAASGNYANSTSALVSQVVNALSTTTKLTSSPNPSTYLTSVTFTATVSATTGEPTGTVNFYSCTTSSCGTTTLFGTGSLGSNGQATYSTSSLPVGTGYVEAVYGASGNYLGSTSGVATQVVNALGTTSSLTAAPNPSTHGSSVTFTDTVSASSGTPSGTVTFYSCTTSSCGTKTSLGTGTLTAGEATYSTTSLSVGTTYVEAVYGASGNYATSTSNTVTQKVNQASTSLVLSASPNPSHFGQAITLSAQTTPGSGPTGTVSFYQDAPPNGDLIDTATLNASGLATLVTTALPPGTYSIYAVYSGDTNYLTSQSNTLTLTVGYSSSCLSGTISGGYTVTSGQSICISGKVSGGISVQSGGALFLNGANVSGAITSNGAAAIRICGSNISGNLTVSGTTGYVMIGDGGDDGTPACADNTITGTVTISGNSGGIEIAGDTINGTLSVSGNTGGPEDPEIEGNHINGSLECATSNNPALTDGGQRNTVSGSKTGQCSAGSF